MVKNPPVNTGDSRDAGSILRLGRSPGGGGGGIVATHPSVLAWKSPWTGEPGGL